MLSQTSHAKVIFHNEILFNVHVQYRYTYNWYMYNSRYFPVENLKNALLILF